MVYHYYGTLSILFKCLLPKSLTTMTEWTATLFTIYSYHYLQFPYLLFCPITDNDYDDNAEDGKNKCN